jgi:endogenous inhibitor of DNA gyrase (YacG/DUF329 family)
MATLRCTTCGKQFDSEKSKALPFCCDRCRQIDLGRWLREEISMPVERSDTGEDEEYSE